MKISIITVWLFVVFASLGSLFMYWIGQSTLNTSLLMPFSYFVMGIGLTFLGWINKE